MTQPLPADLCALHDYWCAANYLTAGQIYLQDNALLREPLRPQHIKPRLLGHWGTSPGLSLVYAHLNRVIKARDLDLLFLAGPGHGGPALLANAYLEGTYSELNPPITQDAAGMRSLFRQFSTPGGVPSHASPDVPGSIHEGGELGYVLTHAFGAVFDNPDLIAAAVVGDGEAETGPLEGSWKGIHFLNPARDGAVLPILHLNGYKIAGPTVLGRSSDAAIRSLFSGHGYDVHIVSCADPLAVHPLLAAALEQCLSQISAIQRTARQKSLRLQELPAWPLLVLRTPKGFTGPKIVDGLPIEGTFRAHQVPLSEVRSNPEHLTMLEHWLRSYRPETLFTAAGKLRDDLRALAPVGHRRMSATPYAHGGKNPQALHLPPPGDYAVAVSKPGSERLGSTYQLGMFLRDIMRANGTNFRLFCPDETQSNRLQAIFECTDRCMVGGAVSDDDHVSADGRVMEVLSEHNCEGWLEGYLLTGRHGLFATYEAFALIVASMTTQFAKWLEMCSELPWRKPVPSLNILLTSTCWRNDHNGFTHQGPGFMDTVLSKRGAVTRIYLPPDANCLLSVARHCLASTNYVNLWIIDKQPQLQYLSREAADAHCARGVSDWQWAGQRVNEPPAVILACAGDVPTQETLAAAAWLREFAPSLNFRVVNVVDLMRLPLPSDHPHGLELEEFTKLFGESTDVVFAFHGYAGAVHQLVHGRPQPGRFHVRGYREEGSTTTPFDMTVRNRISRFHLASEALRRAQPAPANAAALQQRCTELLAVHLRTIHETFEDMPEVTEWTWPNAHYSA